ncbi:MAG: carboxypeptidase regulatory-like domain-containing protein, partial [Candidatus Acidiferrales bacterium]
MRTVLVCLLTFQLLFNPIPAAAQSGQSAPAAQPGASGGEATRLPVRRVVLYKNGVGYFEHLGRVRGSGEVSIEFTSGQLNDVLKSLTTFDLSGGRITGVNYNSDAPLSRRLGALRLPLDQQTSTVAFLNALRGAELQVRGGAGSFTGRLLSVERRERTDKNGQSTTVDDISLITDSGEMRIVELGPDVTVRVVERDLSSEVGRYLDLVSSTRERDLRRMTISTAGSGERQLFVSYISEVPIWKTTYRVVLPSKPGAKPLLQGWAIVDNTVGEDWKDVELSLVAGAPQSFIQQLSQPYYSRRPVVPLPESAMLEPQTHQATLSTGTGALVGEVVDPSGAVIPGADVRLYSAQGAFIGQTTTDDEGEFSFDSVVPGRYRLEIASTGFRKSVLTSVDVAADEETTQDVELSLGNVNSTVVVESAPIQLNTSDATLSRRVRGGIGGGLGPGRAAMTEVMANMKAVAQGQDLGDLFEYKLKERVTIHKNQSAMVPIVQTDIAAEKVSLWNEARDNARPLRALWLTNSSNLTLDGGSFSVLEDETFAGEGLTDALKPGEKRLLSYAIDLGMLVDTKRETFQERVTKVRILKGVMFHTSEERQVRTYTIRNEDTSPRSLVIEHPVRVDYKLAEDAPKPEETSTGFYRFRAAVEPKATAKFTVTEIKPLETRYLLTDMTDNLIALFLQQKSINARVEQELRKVVAQRWVVGKHEAEIRGRQE